MLTDDQIDYLLQIKKSTSPIGGNTARVMLNALGWSADEVERGIAFLEKPIEQNLPTKPQITPDDESQKKEPVVEVKKNINLKQDPFPVGSVYKEMLNQKAKVSGNRHSYLGMLTGVIVFVIIILAYVFLSRTLN